VTIVAGFKFHDGVVLCADTQETIGVAKRQVPKLRVEEIGGAFAKATALMPMAAAFCAATDNGQFADKLIERAWQSAMQGKSFGQVCQRVERTIKRTYAEFGKIYQPGSLPSVELIYAIKAEGQSSMFSAIGPAVIQEHSYRTLGIGFYLAEFLADRMFHRALSLHQCVILAAYVLFQTKAHIDGCGGESDIAIIRNDGSSGRIDSAVVNAITDNLSSIDAEVGSLLLTNADLDLTDEEVKDRAAHVLSYLDMLRE
jgi:hypothetical protein